MKLGLVLEGGASRTVFSCGVLDALMEENIKADVVVGSSAGISFGISYVSWQKGRNRAIAQRYMNDKRYMGMRHMLNRKNKSYYNIDFVFTQMPRQYLPFDYKGLENYPGKAYGAVTNMITGKAEYMHVPSDEERMKKVLVASCSLPIMFPPVEIDGVPYMDGGITDAIPFKFALSEGADKLIVILTRQKGYVKTKEKGIGVAKMMYRKYPEFTKAMENRASMYNAELEEINRLEKQGKAFVFRPTDTDGFKRTESDPERLLSFFDMGYDQARIKMAELKAFLEK